LALLLQVNASVGPLAGPVQGPYKFREDQDLTTKVVLQNGLTVILREDGSVPLTAITTMFKAGYFDEEDRISGISHVIEHISSKARPAVLLAKLRAKRKHSGATSMPIRFNERTCYYTVVPAENAIKALEIQADALWNSSF